MLIGAFLKNNKPFNKIEIKISLYPKATVHGTIQHPQTIKFLSIYHGWAFCFMEHLHAKWGHVARPLANMVKNGS
jgi:hypothetical protein